jgi:predicted MFS family arabinose efflux permease
MYIDIAPFAQQSGFGRTSVVLFVFGIATVAGLWIVGMLIDRHLRSALVVALALVAAAMAGLGLDAHSTAALLMAVALWGAAFGGAPTLLQTALVDASGPESTDVATSMQTTVYNVGIGAGSLAGGLTLQSAGASALPWFTSLVISAALAIVVAARRHAFPPRR